MADKPKKRPYAFDKLGNVEKSLYSRQTFNEKSHEETPVTAPREPAELGEVPSEWREDALQTDEKPRSYFKMNKTLVKRIFWGSVVFFVLCAGIAAYLFFGGINKISTQNVSIEVSGPSSIGAGDALSYTFTIHNLNNADLEDVNLLVEYPPGTRTADAAQTELLRESEPLGTIPAGGIVNRDKRAVLFGEANTSQHIIISVQYRVKDSSATYFKEQYYDVLISSSPVSLKIDSVTQAVSGNSVDIAADIVSNSSSVVSGLMLKAEYPYGFTYSSASPSPTYANSVFVLGDLKPADRRVIHITGTLTGQEGDTRAFRFTLGLPDKNNSELVGTAFLTQTQAIAIQKPFISATLTLDGDSNDPHAAGAGQSIHGQIAWANNLQSRVVDMQIQVKLGGDTLNKLSVGAPNGFYRSIDNTIVWDKTTNNNFAVIEPGDSGIVSFSFSSLPLSSLLSNLRGNELSVDVSATAQGLSDSATPQSISSGSSRKVRIASNVGLSAKSLYYTGPFSNQGPVPPKADINTTYTIDWAITNTLNDLSDAVVQAVLPGYVTWLGAVNPANESITYDSSSHTVTWDAGDVSAGTGFSGPSREAAFQVAIVPSLSQLGESPVLVGAASIVATDRYTNTQVKANTSKVTTAVSDGTQGAVGRVSQ